jgi:hypothetical protein
VLCIRSEAKKFMPTSMHSFTKIYAQVQIYKRASPCCYAFLQFLGMRQPLFFQNTVLLFFLSHLQTLSEFFWVSLCHADRCLLLHHRKHTFLSFYGHLAKLEAFTGQSLFVLFPGNFAFSVIPSVYCECVCRFLWFRLVQVAQFIGLVRVVLPCPVKFWLCRYLLKFLPGDLCILTVEREDIELCMLQ